MNKLSLRALLESRGLRLVDLARGIGVKKCSVSRWAKNKVPAERVLDVERLTGISRSDLRPDLYPLHRGAA